jgi:hypothetical protein
MHEPTSKTEVNEFQQIDLDKIKSAFDDLEGENVVILRDKIIEIKADVLELIEHVEADGLLTRVANARREMAEQTLASVY